MSVKRLDEMLIPAENVLPWTEVDCGGLGGQRIRFSDKTGRLYQG